MKNPIENESTDNPRLQALVKELTRQITLLFSESDRIKDILIELEQEGYQVDSLIASLSPASSEGQSDVEVEVEDAEGDADEEDLNPFDHAFLQSIKVRPES